MFFFSFGGKWRLLQPNKAEHVIAERGPRTSTPEARVPRRTEHERDSSKSRLGQLSFAAVLQHHATYAQHLKLCRRTSRKTRPA